jgi:hypothetical protein
MAAHLCGHTVAKLVVEAQPGPISARRERSDKPSASGADHVASAARHSRHAARIGAIGHLSYRVFARPASRFFYRQQRCQDLLLLVNEVTGIGQALGGHGRCSFMGRVDHLSKRLNAHYTRF